MPLMPYYRRRTYRRRFPYRRRRTNRRRRTYGRRFGRSRKLAVHRYQRFAHIRRPLLPNLLVVKMKLRSFFAVDLAAGNAYTSHNHWRVSSINNPHVGTTIRPMGFDQWNAFYDTYTVLGGLLVVKIFALGEAITSLNQPFIAAGPIRESQVSAFEALPGIALESATGFKRVVPQVGGGQNKPFKITLRYRASKFWGSNVVTNSADHASPFSSDPNNNARFYLRAVNVIAGDIRLNIVYDLYQTVLLQRLQPITTSSSA